MWIQIRSMDGSKSCRLDGLSKLTKIGDIRPAIEEKFGAAPECQKLFYRGKQLENDHTLFDYDVQLNDIIQIIISNKVSNEEKSNECKYEKNGADKENAPETDKKESAAYTDCFLHSKYFKVGDKLDVLDPETGFWSEGTLRKITKPAVLSNSSENSANPEVLKNNVSNQVQLSDEMLTYHIVMDTNFLNPSEVTHTVKRSSIRPRAKTKLKVDDLKIGMTVLVNYNMEEPNKLGHYYNMNVTDLKESNGQIKVFGSLILGSEETNLTNMKLTHVDKIWKVESLVEVSNRSKEVDDNLHHELRPVKPSCDECNDHPRSKCKKCSCMICGGKDQPDRQILCDECDGPYHLWCLTPPLSSLPDAEYWYCTLCKNDETEIVRAGEKLKHNQKKSKMPSANIKSQRDWGRGMATAGRTKKCTIVPENHLGHIPGVEVGSMWKFRVQVGEAGIHRPQVAGIHGREKEGAYSICLSGGYEDDVDNGEEFYYTGSGGRDLTGNRRTAEQSSDQELTRMNKALAMNCAAPFNSVKGAEASDWQKGKSVRVVRNYKGHKHSKYCPEEGNRYDGIYKVVKYWPETGRAGFIVWRYLFRRDDKVPAPWTEAGKERIKKLQLSMEYPPGYEEKGKNLKEKKSKRSSCDSSESSDAKKIKIDKYVVSDEMLSKVETDSGNKKLWDVCMSVCSDGQKSFLDKVEELFTCVCCQDVVDMPILTECHHNICKSCLRRSFKSEVYTCPCCRFDLGKSYDMRVNEVLRDILLEIFPGYNVGRN